MATTESLVLVIFCGGTIGMLKSAGKGYVPEPFYLTETLRLQSRFHDPGEDSLFSHSDTVEGYREWSRSGRTTPLNVFQPMVISQHHLLVRSSRKITVPQTAVYETRESPEGIFETYLPSLVTPRGSGPRIRYTVLEWNPLLDSSNLEPPDWVRIATEIELNYTQFDAFVILHGTDTMAYTASALSFLLEDLGKTVILTGAQIPLSEWRNDAVDNLLGSLCIAGQYIIPECCVYFNHTLYRGNRVSKSSILDFDAFNSPNFPPLMKVGIEVDMNWNEVLRQPKPKKFRAHKAMSTNVVTLRLFPGITASSLRAFLADPIEGVVLEAFGSGNAPNREDILEVFKKACARGVVIVAISQCAKGTVSDAYATGIALMQSGVVPGGDMTPECALTKLGYLLSKPELTREQVRALMQDPLRGELTLPNPMEAHGSVDASLEDVQDVLSQIVRLSSSRKTRTKTLQDMENNIMTTAPWSWTNAETLSAGSVLLPVLIHLAAARNDTEALTWCIKSSATYEDINSQFADRSLEIRAAGIVNCIDVSSGMSPLHVAALHGNEEAAVLLLEAGALVHVRDLLDHTALYYAARQGHALIVDRIVEAGGLLAGSDVTGGFVNLGVQTSLKLSREAQLTIWLNAGAQFDMSTKIIESNE